MSGIHRERPGAEAIAPCTGEPARDLGDGIWMSPGLSNSYLLRTGDGPVILNTGMGFEGPLHRRAYHDIAEGPIEAIILTQGHYDHVGGVDALRHDATAIVAHANWQTWRDDNERLEAYRSRNAAFAWIDAIMAAVNHARSLGIGEVAQSRPEPTTTFVDTLDLDIGGRSLRLLSVAGGETTDALAVWLPESSTVFTGNLTGPLFGHVPNLVTMRGDHYRDPLAYVASLQRIIDLGAERLITGHFDPIDGAERIAAELEAMRDVMLWVHDRTVEGMNRGTDVHTLMREIGHPEHLDVGEGYGRTSWNVRAIWELYSGWFHHRSSTELYSVPFAAVAPDVVAAAGAGALLAAADAHLRAGRPLEALHLAELVLSADSSDEATALAAVATRQLLDASENFWESAWLSRSLSRLEGDT